MATANERDIRNSRGVAAAGKRARMKSPPRVCILKADGTNCDEETAHAFALARGAPERVHVNQLREKRRSLRDYAILAISGGFSYGDDIVSGKVLALELISYLADELRTFVASGKLVLGICNGFQVLVRTGLLPFQNLGTMDATLVANDSGVFECRWVNLVAPKSPCIFTEGLEEREISLMVAHGEGRFFAEENEAQRIVEDNLIALRYSSKGVPTSDYPANPNGSMGAIAGVCDPTGRIFGLMPHPERFVKREQHPNWRRLSLGPPHGLPFFVNAVNFAKQNL